MQFIEWIVMKSETYYDVVLDQMSINLRYLLGANHPPLRLLSDPRTSVFAYK